MGVASRRGLIAACILLGLVGCDDTPGSDAGSDGGADAGPGEVDAGPGDSDAGPSDAGDDDSGPGDTDAGSDPRTIPDPGASMDRWAPMGTINIPAGHGTPETAFLVGTVTEDPWYIGGVTDAVTGDAFWVFRTAPTVTQIMIPMRGLGLADIDFLHLHDGAGLVFGPEITPDSYVRGMDGGRLAIDATWTVIPDHIYVVEVHGSMGSFF